MLKRLLFLISVLFSSMMTVWASEASYSPSLEVCFRTGAGNTAWNSGYPKNAADEGNTTFEGNYSQGIFSLQKSNLLLFYWDECGNCGIFTNHHFYSVQVCAQGKWKNPHMQLG